MQKDARAELARAGALHRQGRLEEAIGLYRGLMKVAPAFEIERLLILALLQSGRVKEAHGAARRARDAHRANPHAHLLMGAALQAEKKWDRALDAFTKAAELDPGLVEAHYLAGTMLAQLGRHAEAAERFGRVLELAPDSVEARANRAVALLRLGRPLEALADCDRLLELQPAEARHHVSKAAVLLELGHAAAATRAAMDALVLAPGLGDAHFLKGQGLAGQGDLIGARNAFADAQTAAPDRATFQAALIRTERQLGHLERARALAEAVVARDPGAALVWKELAEARRELNDGEGAHAAADRALAADPRSPAALATKARLLLDDGAAPEAGRLVDAALALDPGFAPARCLKAAEDLADGRWAAGWAAYDRRSALRPPPFQPLPFPRWDGQEMPGELIVVGERTIGDLILFGRLLRGLADRGIRARLLTQACHVPLLSRLDARVPVVSDLAAVDPKAAGLRWAPLAALPGLMAPDPADWPPAPYLMADPARIGRWRGLFEAAFTVGIRWRADGTPDAGRSVPLDLLAPLAAIDGVELVSLQPGEAEAELDGCLFSGRVTRLGPGWDEGGTLVDTAALLQHLDLVVSVDGALAHLAGARGRPALVALTAAADWRWGKGERSAFYPSLSLVRQTTPGAYAGVLARIARMVADSRRR